MDTYSVEYLKLCAARFVWPQRDRLTPSSRTERTKAFPDFARIVTWAEWWERMFGEDYYAYAKANGLSA